MGWRRRHFWNLFSLSGLFNLHELLAKQSYWNTAEKVNVKLQMFDMLQIIVCQELNSPFSHSISKNSLIYHCKVSIFALNKLNMATAILGGFLCNNRNHICMYIFICFLIYCFHRHFLWGWEMDSSLPGLMAWKGRTGMIMKAFKKMLCVQVYMSSEQIKVVCLLILSLCDCMLFWVL